VLTSVSNQDLAYTLEEQLEATCSIDVTIVEGDIEWTLTVREPGTSTDCMTDVLTKMMAGTSSKDWESRVSSGQIVHTSKNYKAIRKLEYRLEHKCGCKLDKTPVYD
jgi:hypothetical protein